MTKIKGLALILESIFKSLSKQAVQRNSTSVIICYMKLISGVVLKSRAALPSTQPELNLLNERLDFNLTQGQMTSRHFRLRMCGILFIHVGDGLVSV